VGFAEWVKEQSAQKALKRIGTVEFHHERYPGLAGLDTKEGQGERDQPVEDGELQTRGGISQEYTDCQFICWASFE
jgi:hypothetical protein